MNTHKTALSLGSFAAFMHLIWSILVAFGWAGPLLTFIHKVHFISEPPMTILPFSFSGAIALIFITFIVGYTIGIIFATIWNKTHEKRI